MQEGIVGISGEGHYLLYPLFYEECQQAYPEGLFPVDTATMTEVAI